MPVREVDDSVVFSIVFRKGQAESHRLPLTHVIATLQSLENLIRSVGSQIQRDAGVEQANGDFGIELLASRNGIAFRRGSIKAQAVITRNIQFGIQAVQVLLNTSKIIEKGHTVPVNDIYSERALRQLPMVTRYQEDDKTELHLSLTKGKKLLTKATLGEKGRETLRQMEAPQLTIEAVTIYGKLRELRDPSREESRTGYFWGELVEESGNPWRVRFHDHEQDKVLSLFRRQVRIVGDATHFRTKSPRLDAHAISEDTFPDYLAGLEQIEKAYEDVFQDQDAEEILRQIRE